LKGIAPKIVPVQLDQIEGIQEHGVVIAAVADRRSNPAVMTGDGLAIDYARLGSEASHGLDDQREAVARKAIDRKTGARGLRSILESILLDTMFDLPSLEGVEEVVISKEVVEGTTPPLYVYAARANDASAS
jgi:hypothetical protein